MNTKEFAQQIRNKYPGAYDDMSDVDLTNKIVAKYPVYKSQITDFQSMPTTSLKDKIGGTLKDFGIGVTKGLADTTGELTSLAKPVTNLIDEGALKLAGKIKNATPEEISNVRTQMQQPKQEFAQQMKDFSIPQNTAQSIGKGAEQIAEFVIPETAGLKAVKAAEIASPVVRGAAKALTSFGTGAGIETLKGGSTEEALTTGGVSAAMPVVLKGLGKVISEVSRGTAGFLSGKGTKVIDAIIENPDAAIQGLKQEGITTLKQSAKTLQDLSNKYYEGAKKEFANTLSNIKSKITNIDTQTVQSKIAEVLADNNIAYSIGKNGKATVDLSGFAGDNKALLQKTFNLIKDKTLNTIDDIEETAKIVNKQKRNTSSPEMQSILGNISQALRSAYTEQLEKMGLAKEANIAKSYAEAMNKLENFDNLFGTDFTSKIFKETTETTVMKKLDDILSGQKVVELSKIKDLGGDTGKILGKEAGRLMQEGISRSQASIGGDITTMLNAILPSKMVGYITAYLAKTGNKVQPVIDIIKNNPSIPVTTKQSIIQILENYSGAFSNPQSTDK